MKKLKVVYGIDPTKSGFFAPQWAQKKKELMEVRRGDPVTFHSTYQGSPENIVGGVFREDDLKFYNPPPGLHLGIQSPEVRNFVERGMYVVQAWDTAFSAKRDADYTVGITGVIYSCNQYHRPENDESIIGPCEPHYDLYLLDLYRELLDFPDLTKAVRSQHLKWHPKTVLIEDRASGISLIQVLKTSGINVEGVKAIEGKRARATTTVGTGSVQGWMNLHRVLIPAGQIWVEPFIKELVSFTGDGQGYDDQVDALVTAVIYTIQMSSGGVVKFGNTADVTSVEDMRKDAALEGVYVLGQSTIIDSFSYNPCEESCLNCLYRQSNSYCDIQKRKVVAFDSCEYFKDKEGKSKLWV